MHSNAQYYYIASVRCVIWQSNSNFTGPVTLLGRALLGHSYPHRRVNYIAGTVEQFGLWRGVRWTAGSISIIPMAVEPANRLRLLWDRPALRVSGVSVRTPSAPIPQAFC